MASTPTSSTVPEGRTQAGKTMTAASDPRSGHDFNSTSGVTIRPSTQGDSRTSSARTPLSKSSDSGDRATTPDGTRPDGDPGHRQSPNMTSALLTSLPPPEPYSLVVRNLSLQAPPPPVQIPFTIPIALPHGIARRLGLAKDVPEAKELLHGINFECLPGELLAIIGGSGSGKTTALNAAAMRTANLRQTRGAVSFLPQGSKRASRAINKRNTGSVVGYVRQDDFLLPYLSVRETLEFAAALRLPSTVDASARAAIVQQTMAELGLSDVADVIVGGPNFKKGISGGERRRLSIGCILVTLPSVLLLDEPTTGLDATTAYHILQLLSDLARKGRTIVITIHQPRSDAFALFDRLCLLSSGSIVYSGLRSQVLPYFARLGLEPRLHTNPLDFLLDISSVDQRTDEAEVTTGERVRHLVEAWSAYEESNSPKGSGEAALQVNDTATAVSTGTLQGKWRALHLETLKQRSGRPGLVRQSQLLINRAARNLLRDRLLLLGFLLQAVVIGLASGATFYLGAGPTNPNEIQTFKTVLFQSHSAFFYLSIVLFIFLFCQNLVVFDREREDGLYGALPYVLSTFVSYLPVNIIGPGIYAIIIYFMCGFRRDNLARNLFVVLGDYWMVAQAVMGYALLMCSFIRSFAEASMLGNALSIIFVICAGYLILGLPGYIAWTRFFAPYYYGFHWIATEQLRNRDFACVGVTGVQRNQCSGEQVLAGLRFEGYPTRDYPLGLLGFILVVFFLSTVTLHFYRPGGVKFAKQQISSSARDKIQEPKPEKVLSNTVSRSGPIAVELRRLHLTVRSRSLAFKRPGSRRSGKRRSHQATDADSDKVIIEDITAKLEPGRVTAILGPSGSGKTSLLQLLAGRLSKASAFHWTGEVLFNGRSASSATRSLVGYVEQHDDYHLPALTVRETLHYAAALRLRGLTRSAKRARAEEVLRSLGLKSCADNLVGGELVKGISGGEKRRLSLAVELLSDPSVLLVDEPTSGLDAYNARSVMEVLRDIADSGRTVVVSIHQPSTEIWESFDDTLVLAKGGRTVTFVERERILDVFRSSGFACPEFYNPADYILDTIAIDTRTTQSKEASLKRLEKVISGCEAYKSHRHMEGGMAGKQERPGLSSSTEPRGSDTLTRYPSQAFAIAFPVVLSRAFKNLRRQKDVFVVRLFNPPFLAILFWLFFLRLTKGPTGAQNRVGLLQENSALPFVGMLTAVAIFPKERDAFFHERIGAAKYSTLTFLLSYTAQELPMQIVAALLYSVISIYGMALQGSPRIFFEYAVAVWGALSFGESVGIIFCSWIRNGGLSISMVSVALTIMAQVSGIMSVSIPHWLQVIAWGAPIKYLSRIQIINEMRGLTFRCDAASIESGVCIAETGDQLLDTFRINDRNTAKFVGIFIGVIFIYRLLAYGALRLRVALL